MLPFSWRSRGRTGVVLALLFAIIFVASYLTMSQRPYATLRLAETCALMRFSPDGATLLTAGYDPQNSCGRSGNYPIRLWDVKRGIEHGSVAAEWTGMDADKVCFSPDGRLFTARDRDDGGFKLWDASTGGEAAVLTRAGLGEIFQVSPDGRFILFETASDPGHLILWDVHAGREIRRIEYFAAQMVFAADSRSFATVHAEWKKGFRRMAGLSLWTLDASRGPVLNTTHALLATSVAFSPDLSVYATADLDGRISVWDMATGAARFSEGLDAMDKPCFGLRFLQGGRTVVAESGARKIMAWDVTSGRKWSGPYTGPFIFGCGGNDRYGEQSPDGEYLACPMDNVQDVRGVGPLSSLGAGARLVKLPDLAESGRFVMTGDAAPLDAQCRRYLSARFSPDGKMLAVGELVEQYGEPLFSDVLPRQYNPFPHTGGGSFVRVWDVATRAQLVALTGESARFSPDGMVLAVQRDDQTIDLWRLPFGRPLLLIFAWAAGLWLAVAGAAWLVRRLWLRRRRLRNA